MRVHGGQGRLRMGTSDAMDGLAAAEVVRITDRFRSLRPVTFGPLFVRWWERIAEISDFFVAFWLQTHQ